MRAAWSANVCALNQVRKLRVLRRRAEFRLVRPAYSTRECVQEFRETIPFMSKGNKLEKVQFFVAFAIALLIVLTVSFLFLQVSKQLLTKEMNSPWLAQMLRVVMSIVGLSDLTILKARVPPCSIRHSRAAARLFVGGRCVYCDAHERVVRAGASARQASIVSTTLARQIILIPYDCDFDFYPLLIGKGFTFRVPSRPLIGASPKSPTDASAAR